MATDVGTLRASLVLDASKYVQAMDQATKKAGDLAGKIDTATRPAFARLQGHLQAMVVALPQVAGSLATLGGVMAPLAVAAGAWARGLAQDIARLDDLSRQTGVSVGALQAFEHAARRAGAAPDALVAGLGRVNTAIEGVLEGKADATRAFDGIGVDLRALVRDGASTEQILEATARALHGIEDPTRRAAAQVALFGTSGRGMSTVLDTIAQKSLPGYVDELRNAGIVTSEETTRMARDFDAFFRHLELGAKGFVTDAVVSALKDAERIALMVKANLGDVAAAAQLARTSNLQPTEVAEGLGAHEIVRPGLIAPTPRAIPEPEPSTTELRRAMDAVSGMRLLNREWEEGKRLGDQYADALNKFDLAKLTEDMNTAVQSFGDYVPAVSLGVDRTTAWLDLTGDGTQMVKVHTQAINEQAQEYQVLGTNVGNVNSMLATYRQLQAEGAQVTLDGRGALQNFDREVAIGQALAEGASGSLERYAASNARLVVSVQASRTALSDFVSGLESTTTQLGQRFTDWTTLGQQTARDLHTAFSDSFFLLMTGDLDDLDEVWKGFFTSLVRQITDFLASEAVKALMGFVTSLATGGEFTFNIGTTGSGSSSLGGQAASVAGQTALKGGYNYATTGSVLGTGATGTAGTVLVSSATGTPIGVMPAAGLPSFAMGAGGGAGASTAGAGAAGAAGVEAGTAGGAGGGAGAAGIGASTVAGVAAIAAIAAVVVHGIVTRRTTGFDTRLDQNVQEMAEFQTSLAKGGQTFEQFTGSLHQGVLATEEFQAEFSGLGEGFKKGAHLFADFIPDQLEIMSDFTRQRLDAIYGDQAGAVQQLIAQQAAAIEAAMAEGVAEIAAGQTVSLPPNAVHEAEGGMQTVTKDFSRFGQEAQGILSLIPGANELAAGVQQNLTNFAATFEGNRGALIEWVQAIAEMTTGLHLSTDAAAALVDQGVVVGETFTQTADLVAQLSASLLDSSNGVGDINAEAEVLASTLASGTVPADQLAGLFHALAAEHGPGFVDALTSAVEQLGLSNDQAQNILDAIETMADGVTVPVKYDISVSGSPPPGAGGPPVSIPFEGKAAGGWADRPQLNWIGEAGTEVVLPRAGGPHGQFTREFAAAVAGELRGAGPPSDPEDRELMTLQNGLLREIRDELRRRRTGGRPAGANV